MTDIGPIRILCAPNVSRLSPGDLFNQLSTQEQFYVHHSAQAAWSGTHIILQQVSPESQAIFNFILELYWVCVRDWTGDWTKMANQYNVAMADVESFLNYAAIFLGNIGNYFGKGDQKFVPTVTIDFLRRIALCSPLAIKLFNEFEDSILAEQPCSLGPPSNITQSAYYPDCSEISQEEIDEISTVMHTHSIGPENTRIQKTITGDGLTYTILQASVEISKKRLTDLPLLHRPVYIHRGDYSSDLEYLCQFLGMARPYSANPLQAEINSFHQRSFISGDLNMYKEGQRLWVKDKTPSIETNFGFVEPYRDPFGIRAEFEGIVGLVNKDETKALTNLVHQADKFLRRLPWVNNTGKGNGAFEKESFGSPDFTSVHSLAYCSSIIFPGVNLPNYNEIRQSDGCKNIMITNSMFTKGNQGYKAVCIQATERAKYLQHYDPTYHLWVVIHEALGHGTGKFLEEDRLGNFNFDATAPPINPVTNKPIDSWYGPDETWTGIFGAIATSVDECRAECVGAYFMSDMELLALFGYTEHSPITGRDLEYNMYLQLGVAGLRALENYNPEANKWGQAHSRGHFAIFKCLLAAGDFMTVEHNPAEGLIVSIDRYKIKTHGRVAIEALLLRLHIYRCTADFKGCSPFYEALTKPEGQFLDWRQTMRAQGLPREVFVQPNTFETDGCIHLKEYDNSVEGVIRSWAERMDELNRCAELATQNRQS